MTDPEQLKAEIAQTRSDLAETVDELSHRMDPREQAKSAARAGSEAVRTHRVQLVIAAGLVCIVVLARVVVRRRSSPSQHLNVHRPPVRIMYKPWGVIAGVAGGMVAGAVFKQIWR